MEMSKELAKTAIRRHILKLKMKKEKFELQYGETVMLQDDVKPVHPCMKVNCRATGAYGSDRFEPSAGMFAADFNVYFESGFLKTQLQNCITGFVYFTLDQIATKHRLTIEVKAVHRRLCTIRVNYLVAEPTAPGLNLPPWQAPLTASEHRSAKLSMEHNAILVATLYRGLVHFPFWYLEFFP